MRRHTRCAGGPFPRTPKSKSSEVACYRRQNAAPPSDDTLVWQISDFSLRKNSSCGNRLRTSYNDGSPGRHHREIGRQISGLYMTVGVTVFVDVDAGPGTGLHEDSNIGIFRHAVVGFAILTVDRPPPRRRRFAERPALGGSRSGAGQKSSDSGLCRLLPLPTRRCWRPWGSAGWYRHRGPSEHLPGGPNQRRSTWF